jgi:hypothetical protein
MHSPTGGIIDCDVAHLIQPTLPRLLVVTVIIFGCISLIWEKLRLVAIARRVADIARQCSQIVVENPQGRIETIIRLEVLIEKDLSSRTIISDVSDHATRSPSFSKLPSNINFDKGAPIRISMRVLSDPCKLIAYSSIS